MLLLNRDCFEIKKSKFLAYYYKIDSVQEIKSILDTLRKDHKKAKHVAFAYRLGNTAGKSDDKEPSGSAGLPLYRILEMNNLDNSLLVVVRYFGGVKLGVGPLSRAYKEAGNKAINNK